jgi:hypothetical protein
VKGNSPGGIFEAGSFDVFDRLPLAVRRALNDAWFNWAPRDVELLLAEFGEAQLVAVLPKIDEMHAAKSR